MRDELKRPLGELIAGKETDTLERLLEKIKLEKPEMIITVGDQTTTTALSHGVKVHVYIFDKKVKRKNFSFLKTPKNRVLNVKNPAAMLTSESISTVKRAIKDARDTGIFVDGEEDLLTLPAILYAPIGALVIYGQPDEGVVVVKVTEERKKYIKDILKRMEVIK
jgi:uncharacterized protein (UPF0218 family)